jgi:rsbT antagonist protein RsbS
MDKIPILRLAEFLLVTIQVDFHDRLAEHLEADLIRMVKKTSALGILIDISSVSIVDSFMGRILGNIAMMARVMGAETVIVGMQPAVAITLVELGLPLNGLSCELNVDRGMELLRSRISTLEGDLKRQPPYVDHDPKV